MGGQWRGEAAWLGLGWGNLGGLASAVSGADTVPAGFVKDDVTGGAGAAAGTLGGWGNTAFRVAGGKQRGDVLAEPGRSVQAGCWQPGIVEVQREAASWKEWQAMEQRAYRDRWETE